MRILHITPHLGGGVGTVIMGWMEREEEQHVLEHAILCLDTVNNKARKTLSRLRTPMFYDEEFEPALEAADIVLCHYWDHPMMAELLSKPLPDCRLVFWHHNNLPVPQSVKDYPDLFIGTSPIQGYERHIWSTGGISRFLDLKQIAHDGFNVGYIGTVDYKKIHPDIYPMCKEIKRIIPEARFTFVGDGGIGMEGNGFNFVGKVDDVAPYLAEMDVFGYPLRPDHYGTCEQALGEAMAAGVEPVVMNNPAEAFITGNNWVAQSTESYVKMVCGRRHNDKYKEIRKDVAKKIATSLYSIDWMVKAWDEVFDEMMEMPKRSHG